MKAHYKHIQTESNLFTCMLQENKEDFDYPWHFHPEFELTYILSEGGVRYVGNNIENYFEHDLVLVGPNLPHSWVNTRKDRSSKAIVVYLKEQFVDKTWIESPELEGIRRLLTQSAKGIKFDKKVALKLKEKFLQLVDASPFEKLMTLLTILQDLAQSAEYQVLCESGFDYDLNTTDNRRINAVYKYIHENYRNKIRLRDIAAEVNMTEEYFSRYFSKVMKKSFVEFLNEYKINKACKALIETDKQIAEICYDSGFESIPFFYRQFKKFKNCQPKNYRSRYKETFA